MTGQPAKALAFAVGAIGFVASLVWAVARMSEPAGDLNGPIIGLVVSLVLMQMGDR